MLVKSSFALSLIVFVACAVSAKSLSAQEQKKILILGDSISMGYTNEVKKAFAGRYLVFRAQRNGRPENCQGTNHGVKHIDRWLKIDGGEWDLIHFNFGLHDLKRVHPKTRKNSTNPEHPNQADLETYEKQLRAIVKKLKKTGAKLIFATTTPVPEGVRPHRDVDGPEKYNAVAMKVMKENGVVVNDLFSFAETRLSRIQKPADVHFTKAGSRILAEQVVKSIAAEIE